MKYCYYVYTHTDPQTHEIVYVGKGVYGRAWDVTRARKQSSGHCDWMKALSDKGYLPVDWVDVTISALTEKEAYEEEKHLLHSIGGTRFNGQSGERNYQAKLTDDEARAIYVSSESVKNLAFAYSVSRAAIYHIKKGTQWRAATYNIRN